MSKPSWLKEKERQVPRRFKMCINCKHVGPPCGMTNNLGSGKGRAVMYRCKLHPTVQLYFKTVACTDYEYGPTGIS